MELRFDETHIYRYDKPVHETANSTFYKAMDVALKRTVGLKKIKITGNTPAECQNAYNRSMQEVSAMLQIAEYTARIPNIYSTYFDKKNNELYIVMQWISGESLAKKMEKKVPDKQFLIWIRELCGVLGVMEQKRFYHKDIKPENIMFNVNNELYLIDFNLTVSAPSQLEGTIDYKAPEMDFNSSTMARDKADMFSIGVMLYRQFTGKVPKRMIDYEIYDVSAGKWDIFTPAKAINPQLDSKLDAIITKLMSYSTKDRYRNYTELSNDILAVIRNMNSKKR